ncbi:MAG: hypothetical protein ACOVRN_01810 [Flavobacterium sp.]
MDKYIIDGNIDFYAELYKSLDDISDAEDTPQSTCLITGDTLTDKYVTLNCGHTFNYIPLYYDVLAHKLKYNKFESKAGKLCAWQFQCPYCRKKQSELLPYYPELNTGRVLGVNYYHANVKYNQYKNNVMIPGYMCDYVFPAKTKPVGTDNPPPSEPQHCLQCYASQIRIYQNDDEEPVTYGDKQHYCAFHKKVMIRRYVKEEAAKKRALEKEQEARCEYVLKMGPRKGHACGCKIHTDQLCKRHYKPL